MRVTVDNEVYLVHFNHESVESGSGVQIRYTKCTIIVEDGQFSGVGYAKVHPKDNFSKEKGRKISLIRALEDSGFSKENKTLFWEVYRKWGKDRF